MPVWLLQPVCESDIRNQKSASLWWLPCTSSCPCWKTALSSCSRTTPVTLSSYRNRSSKSCMPSSRYCHSTEQLLFSWHGSEFDLNGFCWLLLIIFFLFLFCFLKTKTWSNLLTRAQVLLTSYFWLNICSHYTKKKLTWLSNSTVQPPTGAHQQTELDRMDGDPEDGRRWRCASSKNKHLIHTPLISLPNNSVSELCTQVLL